ncbi:MAG: selenium cofactor biosynthesis protein YqeC [Dehalococcoidales bacterium]|nr:selenium cofactor biosynthesis protein YqeC [Dehalococcoidales bacterium]
MKLEEALQIRPGEVISLVGGGGKTSIMFALAEELALAGGCVVTTTTTKIFEPLLTESPLVIVEKDETELLSRFLRSVSYCCHVTLASERLASGKLAGIRPGLVEKLIGIKTVSHVIVEADGAARRPLKAPNDAEPVIPDRTSLVVAVVGVDAVGSSLNEKEVFRAGIAARLLGLPLGAALSNTAIATLVTHRQGITKGSPENARIVPFINKVDRDGGLSQGRELAREILAVGHPGIRHVLLGQVCLAEPVVEIISEGG